MEDHWNYYLRTVNQKKPRHYDDYHPSELFVAVVEDVEDVTTAFPAFKAGPHTIADLLNAAWEHFLGDPLGYEAWQKGAMSQLRRELNR